MNPKSDGARNYTNVNRDVVSGTSVRSKGKHINQAAAESEHMVVFGKKGASEITRKIVTHLSPAVANENSFLLVESGRNGMQIDDAQKRQDKSSHIIPFFKGWD